jgi:hypothetical protein
MLAASISISDATAVEGSDTLKFVDRFVAEGSGGLVTPRDSTFGPDGNNDGAMDFYVASGNSHTVCATTARQEHSSTNLLAREAAG